MDGIESARAAIASGTLRGAALRDRILARPASERDAWIDRVLGFEAPPPDDAELPRGAVPYLPSGVEEILAMVRDVPIAPDDVVVDLGSGLGKVAILVHLLSGARAHGIEIQEHLVHQATARCEALGLDAKDVSFVHGNAAESSLDGSVFYLFAPFNGAMLRSAIERLESVARRRRIVVCAVGLELREVDWLCATKCSCVSLSIYESQAVVAP